MAPRALLLTLLAFLLPTFAGCLGASDGGEPPAASVPVEVDTAPTLRTLYLTGAPGLTPLAPAGTEPQAVKGGNFFTQWGAKRGYAEFVGAPAETALLVTGNVSLTVFARAEGPAAQAGIFPHFIAYFGVDGAYAADGSADASPVAKPGDALEFTVTLATPRDGFLIAPGATPQVLLVAVMTQDDRSGDITFLVNSTATPARVDFEAATVTPPPLPGEGETRTEGGRLAGSAYARVVRGVSQQAHTLEVPARAALVEVRMETGTAAGFADVDLAVVDDQGQEVARSVTPFGAEKVLLHPHQLPGGATQWTVLVTNYGSAAATYTLALTTHPEADTVS